MTEYKSIFEEASIITKKDLCAILNLNTERTNLNFTASEIKQAYKKRALRFHPDKQRNYNPSIAANDCQTLLSDIERARDYLLAGEDNIPGKAFINNNFIHEKKALITSVNGFLNSFNKHTASIQSTVYWLNLASNSFFALIPLSTFSDGQLNLRYVNALTEQLALIRPYIKDIDGTTIVNFLHFLRDGLDNEVWQDRLVEFLNTISTKLVEDMREHNQLDELMQNIKKSREELKKLLTESFIKKIQHIVSFWPQFVTTVPTWKHMAGIFFITMLFTATSIPKYLNAFKVISDTIIRQKGIGPYSLIVLPMLATSLLLLPLNLAINTTGTLVWQALKATVEIFINGLTALSSAFNLLFILNPTSNKKLSVEAFKIFEAFFNIFIRLPLLMLVEIVDSAAFTLTNLHLLSFLSDHLNRWINSLLDVIQPEKKIKLVAQDESEQLIHITSQEQATTTQKEAQTINLNFFANDSTYNETDTWLEDLLSKYQAEQAPTFV